MHNLFRARSVSYQQSYKINRCIIIYLVFLNLTEINVVCLVYLKHMKCACMRFLCSDWTFKDKNAKGNKISDLCKMGSAIYNICIFYTQ